MGTKYLPLIPEVLPNPLPVLQWVYHRLGVTMGPEEENGDPV